MKSTISSEPKKPPWLDFTHYLEEEIFEVSTDVDPYLNDFIGLIIESWRIRNDKEGESSSDECLREAMLKIAERWKMSTDPLNVKKSRRN